MSGTGGKGSGVLHVIATPIGNLGDLSPRAAEVLREADVVVAEDTRRTRTLLVHAGARPDVLASLPAFDEAGRVAGIVERMSGGAAVALVTDAGTPGVSDPGALLVEACWGAGVRVVPVPGPSAALTALSASGLPADRFLFAGFLPRKGGSRAEALRFLASLPVTIVLFEAGNRVAGTLEDLQDALGDRVAAVARELTKLHEEIVRGRLSALRRQFEGEVRGEVTLVVAGAEETPAVAEEQEPVEEEVRRRLAAGEPPTAVARALARGRGIGRGEAYALVESLRGKR